MAFKTKRKLLLLQLINLQCNSYFISCYNLQSLIKEPICLKGEASCTDLIITNNKSYLKHCKTFVTGVSGIQKLIAIGTASKTNFVKSDTNIKYYRSYKKFDTDTFDKVLSHGLTFPPRAFQKVALK